MPHMAEMWTQLSANAPAVVTPGASPYSYVATQNGVMYVSAGTVSLIQLIRGGVTIGVGLLAGPFIMRSGDTLKITYIAAPAMTWAPL